MKTTLVAACFAVLSTPALAASITVSDFNASDYSAIVSGYGTAIVEDFESYDEGNVANGFATSVGTFATLGGTGSGGTVTQADFANDGNMLAVRDGNVYGRTSTTPGASNDKFLDSNDTYGISWMVSLGGSLFNKLALTITDAADVGAVMKVVVGSDVYEISDLGNGAQKLVEIDFEGPVQVASIFFSNWNGNGSTRLNDGFSIDDIAVSEVPLPASALLLLGGLAGLTSLRRKRA